MKSRVFVIENSDANSTFYDEIESIGLNSGLSDKDASTLRLLSEETVEMVNSIMQQRRGMLWVYYEKNNFEIHLQATCSKRTPEQSHRLRSITTTRSGNRRNILSKIGVFFEALVFYGGDLMNNQISCMYPSMTLGMTSPSGYVWSLKQYEESIQDSNRLAEWDGLEQSILLNIADDIKVSLHDQHADLVVYKSFFEIRN